MNISHDDFDLTVVQETPRNDDNTHDHEPSTVKETPIQNYYPPPPPTTTTTLESISEVDHHSESILIQSKFPTHCFSSPCSTSASDCIITPQKQQISNNNSPLDSSVNSHFHKRRKFASSVLLKMSQFDSLEPKPTFPGTQIMNHGDVSKKDLKISCSLCKNLLGLTENDYIVPCSLMSLSKAYLVSIWKGTGTGPTSVPVVVSDISCVDGRIWERSREGIWSKEDGCVFNTTFCPFCTDPDNNCLGLHVVATDSSNVQFLNKVLFYSDRLEIKRIDASSNKEASPSSVTSLSKSMPQNPFEKFAYTSPETTIGWRTTKSKMRLPKKVQKD